MNLGDEVVYISTIQIRDLIHGCDFIFGWCDLMNNLSQRNEILDVMIELLHC